MFFSHQPYLLATKGGVTLSQSEIRIYTFSRTVFGIVAIGVVTSRERLRQRRSLRKSKSGFQMGLIEVTPPFVASK